MVVDTWWHVCESSFRKKKRPLGEERHTLMACVGKQNPKEKRRWDGGILGISSPASENSNKLIIIIIG